MSFIWVYAIAFTVGVFATGIMKLLRNVGAMMVVTPGQLYRFSDGTVVKYGQPTSFLINVVGKETPTRIYSNQLKLALLLGYAKPVTSDPLYLEVE